MLKKFVVEGEKTLRVMLNTSRYYEYNIDHMYMIRVVVKWTFFKTD